MSVNVRLATALDIPTLSHLIPHSARALSGGYYTEQQIESAIQYIFGVDSQLIVDQTYFVATAGEAIVGCGGWSKRKTLYGGDQMKGDIDEQLDPAIDSARIRAFFIHLEWARRGIGRRIIKACEAAARQEGFRSIELSATLPGEPFYAALGYGVTKRFDIELPDGVLLPCAHMVKEFD